MKQWEAAYEDWLSGMKYRAIADKYGVSEGTVKSWASRYFRQKKAEKVATKTQKRLQPVDEKLQPKPKGAPKGNKNALGNSGGAPKHNQNNRKHGAYEQIFWATMSEEELALIEAMNLDAEERLLEQEIQLLTVKEHRMLKDIADYKSRKGGLALDSVVKRNLEIEGNLVKDNRQSQNETTTKTIATFEVIAKLEDGLLKTQRAKIKAIGDLAKMRQTYAKLYDTADDNPLALAAERMARRMDGETDG